LPSFFHSNRDERPITRNDPDVEPFAYSPNYQPAIRNPTALTFLGAVLLPIGLAFVAVVIGLVVAPSSTVSWGFILLSCSCQLASAWSYGSPSCGFGGSGLTFFRRHGAMPVLIGQRARNN
jgi:hypothetical protein